MSVDTDTLAFYDQMISFKTFPSSLIQNILMTFQNRGALSLQISKVRQKPLKAVDIKMSI